MARARVVRGGWSWLGMVREQGDIVEASEAQIEAWARDGYVEPLEEQPAPEPAAATAPRGRGARR